MFALAGSATRWLQGYIPALWIFLAVAMSFATSFRSTLAVLLAAVSGLAVAADTVDGSTSSILRVSAGFDSYYRINMVEARMSTGLYNQDASKSSGGTWISNGEIAIDWNGDGLTDYIDGGSVFPAQPSASAYQPVKLKILINQGDGRFVDQAEQLIRPAAPGRYHFSECVSDDFNRDGRPDLFCVGGGADIPPYGGETSLYLLSAADGKWDDRSDLLPQKPAFGHYAAVGRINGDGIPHLFVHNICGGSETDSYFLLNDGKGGLTQDKSRVPARLLGGNCIAHISSKFADLDGDGFEDMVLGSGHADGIKPASSLVVYNDRHGSFTGTPSPLPAGCFGDSNSIVPELTVADVNGDGQPDILLSATRLQPFYQGGCIQVLINQGNRQFADESAARIASQPGAWVTQIKVIDINNDGYPDIVPALSGNLYYGSGCLASGCESLAQVLVNDGLGHFAALPFALPRVVSDYQDTPRLSTGPFAIRLKAGEPVSLLLTYTGVAGDLNYFRQNVLYQALRSLPPAVPVTALLGGPASAASFSVQLPVAPPLVGTAGAVYLAIGQGTQWFAFDGKGWQLGALPAAYSGVLPARIDLNPLQGFDSRLLRGYTAIGGYGSSLDEMLASGRYKTLYTF